MLSRACFAAVVVVGGADGLADSGVALSRIRGLIEVASSEELSSGTCVPDKKKGVECDMNGNQCAICGPPQPGRGYDGKAVYSSTVTPGTIVRAPDYILRDDCGNHSLYTDLTKWFAPLNQFNQKKSQTAFPSWTNAWCEVNVQKACADALVNRDYLFQAKTLNVPRGYATDFWYCKYNGYLSAESRTIVTSGFDALHNHSIDFCASRSREIPLDSITSLSMAAHQPTFSLENARYVSAWTCAMGGADGESTGAACDMAYCHYTYGELDPAAGSSQRFCMYEECEGWDPKTGMPVSDYMTLAHRADAAGAVYL